MNSQRTTPTFRRYDVASDVEMTDVGALFNRLKPTRAVTVDETRGRLAQETAIELHLARTDDGEVAASLELTTFDLDTHPTLWFAAVVAPELVDVAAMLEQAVELARVWAPTEAANDTRVIVFEPHGEQLAWWQARGFTEAERLLQVELELAADRLPSRSTRDDLRLVSIAERPDLLPRAHEMFCHGHQDMPGDLEFSDPSVERWRTDNAALGIRPDHELVLLRRSATGDEAPVGYASLIVRKARPGVIRHGLTTIARSARRERLGREFKSLLLHFAHDAGFTRIGTSNEVTNIAMRKLNDEVGFEPMPAVLVLRGQLT